MKRFISVCFLVLCCASWCLAQSEDEPSWKLLTNSLGLRAGDQIVIAVADDLAGATTQRVMGEYEDKGNTLGYKTTAVDYNSLDSTITITSNVTVLTLVEDSIPGVFFSYRCRRSILMCYE
jgi:hypothetical protein